MLRASSGVTLCPVCRETDCIATRKARSNSSCEISLPPTVASAAVREPVNTSAMPQMPKLKARRPMKILAVQPLAAPRMVSSIRHLLRKS